LSSALFTSRSSCPSSEPLTLVGGFAVVTFALATRRDFRAQRQHAKIDAEEPVDRGGDCLMWFAMLTKISGDFWSKIMSSHYIYGAIVWAIGVLIWTWKAPPLVLQRDTEE
jgi:uncharacterized protein involved in response to NO